MQVRLRGDGVMFATITFTGHDGTPLGPEYALSYEALGDLAKAIERCRGDITDAQDPSNDGYIINDLD